MTRTRPSFPPSLQLRCRRVQIAGGDRGTAQTIRLMQRLVRGAEGAPHPWIRTAAVKIVAGVGNRDFDGEIDRLFRWVKKHIAFRGEYGETLQSPLVTFQLGAGDCDDHSVLLAALLEALGHQTQFKTQAIGGRQFSHVFVQVLNRRTGGWISLDTTAAQSFAGWEPRQAVTRARSWQDLGDAAPAQPGASRSQVALKVIDKLRPIIDASATRIASNGTYYGSGNVTERGVNLSWGGVLNPSTILVGSAVLLAGTFLLVTGRQGRR